MLKRNLIKMAGLAAVCAAKILAGCGGDDIQDNKPLATKVAEDTAEAIVNQLVNAVMESPQAIEISNLDLAAGEEAPVDFNEVNDLLVIDSQLFAAYDQGLVIFDLKEKKGTLLDSGEKFNALTFYDGKLYAGGEGLYFLDEKDLIPAEIEFSGEVTSLYSEDFRLLIGTSDGLYSQSSFGREQMMENIEVTDLQFDRDGLWVATNGDGLFRWDGERFHRRFLLRDTTIFNHVRDLDFNRDYLYVAAETGFFVFDGGKWTQWTTDDGIPSDCVSAVNADDWMVQVGTSGGMVAYFDKNFYPAKNLDGVEANAIRRLDNKIFIGTKQGEVLMKAGEIVTVLIEQAEEQETSPEVFSQANEEITAE